MAPSAIWVAPLTTSRAWTAGVFMVTFGSCVTCSHMTAEPCRPIESCTVT